MNFSDNSKTNAKAQICAVFPHAVLSQADTSSSTPTRLSAAPPVANAIRSATAHRAGRRFHWAGLQGVLVVALAGAAASTSLARRHEMEEKLEIADARVARAEAKVTTARDALLSSVSETATQVSSSGNAAEKEAVLRKLVDQAVQGEDHAEVPKKTSFV